MAKPFKIDGVDFSSYSPEVGYSVSYAPVSGLNAGVMIDGSYTEDEVKLNAVVTYPCYPLNETQLSTILQAVYNSPYHMVYYYDPKAGAVREVQMRRAIGTQSYKGYGADGLEYWTGTVITFTER